MTKTDNGLSFGNKASHGATWVAFSRIFSLTLRLGTGALLARLLTPAEFGVAGMAFIFAGFLSIFADAGLRSAVVQFRDMDNHMLSNIFWLSAVIGVGCALLLAVLSPLVAAFTKMAQMKAIVPVLGIGLLFSALGSVPAGLLQRQMLFRKTAFVEIVAESFAGLVAVFVAFSGGGYWTLVIQAVTASGVTTGLYYFAARWKPEVLMEFNNLVKIVRFSGNILAFNSINYWARNLDSLLVGRMFGSIQLGYYNRAYSLMMYPYTMLQSVLGPVIHPVFAGMQGDIIRLRNAYLKMIKFMMIISFPIAIVFGILAEPIVSIFWGPQWGPCVPIFRVLCLISAVQPIYAISGNIYLSINRSDLYFKIGSLYVGCACSGMIFGSHWGVMGIAWGYVIANIVAIPIILNFIVVKLLNGNSQELLKQMITPMLLALIICVGVLILDTFVGKYMMPPIRFLTGFIMASCTFIISLKGLDSSFILEVCKIFPKKIQFLVLRMFFMDTNSLDVLANESK